MSLICFLFSSSKYGFKTRKQIYSLVERAGEAKARDTLVSLLSLQHKIGWFWRSHLETTVTLWCTVLIDITYISDSLICFLGLWARGFSVVWSKQREKILNSRL
jgi:hypothetical protein